MLEFNPPKRLELKRLKVISLKAPLKIFLPRNSQFGVPVRYVIKLTLMKRLLLLSIISFSIACNSVEPVDPKLDRATEAFVDELRDVHNLDVSYPADNRANCFRVNKEIFNKIVIPLMDAQGLVYIAEQEKITEKVVIYSLTKNYKSR